jgi:hypothetical protein
MRILPSIFRRLFPKPLELDDPALGHLRFERDSGLWNGSLRFSPTGHEIAVILTADEGGPVEWHRDRFRAFADRYPEVLGTVFLAAFVEVKRWFDGQAACHEREPETAPDWEVSRIRDANDLADHLLINSVEICSDEPGAERRYSYRLCFELFDNAEHLAAAARDPTSSLADPEHELYVELEDWQVTCTEVRG